MNLHDACGPKENRHTIAESQKFFSIDGLLENLMQETMCCCGCSSKLICIFYHCILGHREEDKKCPETQMKSSAYNNDIETLTDMFPRLDLESIVEIYKSTNMNLYSTADVLADFKYFK